MQSFLYCHRKKRVKLATIFLTYVFNSYSPDFWRVRYTKYINTVNVTSECGTLTRRWMRDADQAENAGHWPGSEYGTLTRQEPKYTGTCKRWRDFPPWWPDRLRRARIFPGSSRLEPLCAESKRYFFKCRKKLEKAAFMVYLNNISYNRETAGQECVDTELRWAVGWPSHFHIN